MSAAPPAALAPALVRACPTAAPTPAIILGLDPRISDDEDRRVEPGDDNGGGDYGGSGGDGDGGKGGRSVETHDDGTGSASEPIRSGMLGADGPGDDGAPSPVEPCAVATIGVALAPSRTAERGGAALDMMEHGMEERREAAPGTAGGARTPGMESAP